MLSTQLVSIAPQMTHDSSASTLDLNLRGNLRQVIGLKAAIRASNFLQPSVPNNDLGGKTVVEINNRQRQAPAQVLRTADFVARKSARLR